MNRKLVVIATAVLAAGIGVVVFGSVQRRSRAAPAGPTQHGNGIDHAMSAVLALYKAPAGSTPCESAYKAFTFSQDFAAKQSVTPVVLKLAPHDDFMAKCGALPPLTQQCMVPLYLAEHRVECQKAKPSDDVLAGMVVMKHAAEPGSQAAEQEPAEPAPIDSR